MVAMARKGRVLIITLGVIVALIVVLALAVRIFFTREKLLAMIIPRIEKAIDARVTIGDIGINFPFGFGVDIEALSFEKTLPDTSALTFTSEKVTAKASLVSLIKRKPEITAADIQGGVVTILGLKKGREVRLRGIEAHGRMNPTAAGFAGNAKVLVDSLLVSAYGRPPAIALESIAFDGRLETDAEFTRLAVEDAEVAWADLVTAKIKGEVVNMKTAPRFTLSIEGDERPLAPVLAKAREFKLDELSPKKVRPTKSAAPAARPEISQGTFAFNATIEGLVREPLAMGVSFECTVKDLAVEAGETASIAKAKGDFKGQGPVLAWQGLFPSSSKPVTPAEIGVAWRAVKLEGEFEIEGGEFLVRSNTALAGAAEGAAEDAAEAAGSAAQAAAAPIRVSALKAKARLSGPDVTKLSGEFMIGSSPYEFDGSLLNIMPASAELLLIARALQASGQTTPPDLGPILDRMVNVPVVRLEIAGRTFDARPFQKPLFGAKGEGKAQAPAGAAGAQPAAAGSAAGGGASGAVLFLKNTSFTAKLDSVISREAVITKLEAKGTIRDGRIRVEPATFAYAGGRGAAVVSSDLRSSKRISTDFDFSANGVEADQALSRIHSFGSLVQGTFTLKSNASTVTGAGINSLMALTAAGNALSTNGTLSIEKFIEPLTKIQGFDVTPFKKFNFSDWTGHFSVKNGRFVTDDWKIKSSRGDWTIKGSFGFDGTLDYVVHLVIPPEVQQQMKDIDKYKGIFDLLRDTSGNLVLDIKLGGTTQHPSTSLDLSKARGKVQDKLLEGLRNKILR